MSTRNIAIYRDPAVILIDQLKQIHIDGRARADRHHGLVHQGGKRKEYTIGMNLTGLGVDDPDTNFYENFHSTSDRNYTAYKNPEVDKMIEQQSAELDREKRKKLVWAIEQKLIDDGARPVINQNVANTCWTPQLKGVVLQTQQHLQRLALRGHIWLPCGHRNSPCRRRRSLPKGGNPPVIAMQFDDGRLRGSA